MYILNCADSDCVGQSAEIGACYDVAGQTTLFVGRTRRLQLGGENINAAARESIRDAMDSGELAETVNGIIRLSWVDDEELTNTDQIETSDETLDKTLNETLNGETRDNVGYLMLGISGTLFVGGYGMHRYQKRKERNTHEQQAENYDDDGFEEIA